MKFVVLSFFAFLAAGSLYLAGYGILGIYVGYYYLSWVKSFGILGVILWFSYIACCFAFWRFNGRDTGYAVTMHIFGTYFLDFSPPRKVKLSGKLIAAYSLTLFLILTSFMFFPITYPETARLAREYNQVEKSLFASRISLDEVFLKPAPFVSFRDGVLRHDLKREFPGDEVWEEHAVIPLMRSQETIDPEVRVWLISDSAWRAMNAPLHFRALGSFSAPETEYAKKEIVEAMQTHNIKTHPQALVVNLFSHGADQQEALTNLKKEIRDEIETKIVYWLIVIGGAGLLFGLMGYAVSRMP